MTVDPTGDPSGWSEWIHPLVADLASQDDALAARLGGAAQVHLLEATVPDPPDLGHLQAAWAFVRARMRRGGFAAYDLQAWRWWARDEVLSAAPEDNRPACAWRLLTHTEPVSGDPSGRHLVHSAGLSKFARSELISLVPSPSLDDAQEFLLDIGHQLVLGRLLVSGELLDHRGLRLQVEGYAPGFNAPAFALPFEDQPTLLRVIAA